LGITFSPADDLKTWRDEVGLTGELLCDADRKVAMAYGAAQDADQERPSRISVLIGTDGLVINAHEVSDAQGHAVASLAEIP
jgi:peroxiredoxin